MLTFIDDFSRKVWAYFLKEKSEAFKVFKESKTLLENQTRKKIKRLMIDNGLEFCNHQFDEFCKAKGIARHKTVVNTPQQNGVAERMNCTLLERDRCMLSNAGFGKELWAEAISTGCYLVNRSPNTSIQCKTPEEVWSGKPTDYSNLRVFGCPAYVHVNEGKLEARAKKGVFVGYPMGYKVWCPTSSKFLISRDVTFDEPALLKSKDVVLKPTIMENEKIDKKVQFEVPVQQSDEEEAIPHKDAHPEEQEVEAEPYLLARQCERREIRKPMRYVDFAYCFAVAKEVEYSEPSSYKEFISSKNATDWVSHMNEELQSLERNYTWTLVKPPNGKKIVGCKWVFKKKVDGSRPKGLRYKARLVAKGFSQVQGVNFNEVFSPVVKHTSIQVFISLVAIKDLEFEQLDVIIAFLHGDLEEQIYMKQSESFEVVGKENHVCFLKKSLYGLKQSPQQWYKKFESFMVSINFSSSNYDICVYFKKLSSGEFIYLLLYVDDMLIAASNMEEIVRLKEQLGSAFEMKDLRATKRILGMEISRDRPNRKLFLSQKEFVGKVIRHFSMEKAKIASTPLATHFKLSATMSPKSEYEK